MSARPVSPGQRKGLRIVQILRFRSAQRQDHHRLIGFAPVYPVPESPSLWLAVPLIQWLAVPLIQWVVVLLIRWTVVPLKLCAGHLADDWIVRVDPPYFFSTV